MGPEFNSMSPANRRMSRRKGLRQCWVRISECTVRRKEIGYGLSKSVLDRRCDIGRWVKRAWQEKDDEVEERSNDDEMRKTEETIKTHNYWKQAVATINNVLKCSETKYEYETMQPGQNYRQQLTVGTKLTKFWELTQNITKNKQENLKKKHRHTLGNSIVPYRIVIKRFAVENFLFSFGANLPVHGSLLLLSDPTK